MARPPDSLSEGRPEPAMMISLLRRVRQTRDFRPSPVAKDAMYDILEAARWTGSVSNRQPWTFIVVTNPETRRQMAEAATNTPHIGVAPVVVVVALEPHGIDTDNFDEGRVAERIMIAAAAHGLSSGIGRAGQEAQASIGRLLGVPADRVVRTMVSIGYPTDAGARSKTPAGAARKPLETIVRWERFG